MTLRSPLKRIPPESRLAAVVLGAALAQVGLLAALGLQSSEDRQEALRQDLAERTRETVSREVVAAVRRGVAARDKALGRELGRETGTVDRRIAEALRAGAPIYERAYLLFDDGALADWRRCPYPPGPAGPLEPDARQRLDVVLRTERTDPTGAIRGALALEEDVAAGRSHDVTAAALALQAGWRAALLRDDAATAVLLAEQLQAGYRLVRDDRGVLGEAEPLGLGAAALVTEVRLDLLRRRGEPEGPAFAAAVLGRRVQAQRMAGAVSPEAYSVEVEACKDLLAASRVFWADEERRLEKGLVECDAVDRWLVVARSVRPSLRLAAMTTGETLRLPVPGASTDVIMTVAPLARSPGAGGTGAGAESVGPVGVAFLSGEDALREHAVAVARRAPSLAAGLALVVRDAENRDLLDGRVGPGFVEEEALGDAAPGLRVGAVVTDRSLLFREMGEDRRLWLWILAGAGLAVVAASLLAVRAVLREVRLARMKSDFVSNLSHELRTPLTSLRMFVETLQEGRVRDENEAKECLDVIAQETDRLAGFVDRILTFAAFSKAGRGGRSPVELLSGDAGEVVGHAVDVFRKKADAAGVRLELRVGAELPESILDREALTQVVLNLLDNAVKYGGDNGTHVRVSVLGDRGRVHVDVEDEGPGVPDAERYLVFEEFYRGDDVLSSRVQGTGIGLALARRMVRAHGGTIDVRRSADLAGALFRVTLPDAAAGRRIAAENARRAAGGS